MTTSFVLLIPIVAVLYPLMRFLAIGAANARERWQCRRERAPKPYKRDSSGVAPASPQVAYRALLERGIGRPPKKVGRIFGPRRGLRAPPRRPLAPRPAHRRGDAI